MHKGTAIEGNYLHLIWLRCRGQKYCGRTGILDRSLWRGEICDPNEARAKPGEHDCAARVVTLAPAKLVNEFYKEGWVCISPDLQLRQVTSTLAEVKRGNCEQTERVSPC